MPEMIFYSKPVVLNKGIHKNLKIANRPIHYGFAAQTNSVMLTGGEFIESAKEYPVVFVRTAERIVPAVLLGLREAENLFVDPDGRWESRYIPAFVRRYPFVPSVDAESDAMTVCIDESFPGFVTSGEGAPLFDDQEEPSLLLQNAIQFLLTFQEQIARTDIFVNRLDELGLFVELSARADLVNGQQYAMKGFLVVDEQKILGLDTVKAMELFRCGELGWIYAHLFSLSNMGRLVDLLARRTAR